MIEVNCNRLGTAGALYVAIDLDRTRLRMPAFG